MIIHYFENQKTKYFLKIIVKSGKGNLQETNVCGQNRESE